MKCGLCGRQGEDQPVMSSIHGLESKNVAEESSIRLDILAVDKQVSARNHLPLPKKWPKLRLNRGFGGTSEVRS
jgi:hypothetical protein